MAPQCPDFCREWSDALAARLLDGLSDEQLAAMLSPSNNGALFSAGQQFPAAQLRQELVRLAGSDHGWRVALCRAWRGAHEELVAAARMVGEAAPDLTAGCAALVQSFSPEELVLELLTDESDAGWQLVDAYLDLLESVPLRRQLAEAAARLRADQPVPVRRQGRVVVFGGHPRDESKLRRRLLAQGSFDVRWKTCEKSHGDPDDVTLTEAL